MKFATRKDDDGREYIPVAEIIPPFAGAYGAPVPFPGAPEGDALPIAFLARTVNPSKEGLALLEKLDPLFKRFAGAVNSDGEAGGEGGKESPRRAFAEQMDALRGIAELAFGAYSEDERETRIYPRLDTGAAGYLLAALRGMAPDVRVSKPSAPATISTKTSIKPVAGAPSS